MNATRAGTRTRGGWLDDHYAVQASFNVAIDDRPNHMVGGLVTATVSVAIDPGAVTWTGQTVTESIQRSFL